MVVVDAVARRLPGRPRQRRLRRSRSRSRQGLLEYPQYTRPPSSAAPPCPRCCSPATTSASVAGAAASRSCARASAAPICSPARAQRRGSRAPRRRGAVTPDATCGRARPPPGLRQARADRRHRAHQPRPPRHRALEPHLRPRAASSSSTPSRRSASWPRASPPTGGTRAPRRTTSAARPSTRAVVPDLPAAVAALTARHGRAAASSRHRRARHAPRHAGRRSAPSRPRAASRARARWCSAPAGASPTRSSPAVTARSRPFAGPADYNHLIVRSACAIILDRLYGDRED